MGIIPPTASSANLASLQEQRLRAWQSNRIFNAIQSSKGLFPISTETSTDMQISRVTNQKEICATEFVPHSDKSFKVC